MVSISVFCKVITVLIVRRYDNCGNSFGNLTSLVVGQNDMIALFDKSENCFVVFILKEN